MDNSGRVASSVPGIRTTADIPAMDKGMPNVTFGQPYSYYEIDTSNL